ncbi:MAG: exo-beta-N-acetylmuramidase NamZ domain-containing protein, partial [Myxococcota bacterium]
MRFGLDRLPQLSATLRPLRAGRVGLLTHPASVNQDLQHIGRVLHDLGVRPHRIFGPEHGYGGEAQDMIGVDHATDPVSGAPIVSLYGDSFDDLTPRADQLKDLDVALVDLCDVGSRYYTFIWTALLFVQAAHAAGVPVVLLDRPNPLGGTRLEGRPQNIRFLSFVGLRPVPVRHGRTVGEVVAEMAQQDGIAVGPKESLDVVAVQGWQRDDDAHDWDRAFVMPSPNMPTVDTAIVYPGGCLLEGTNLSEGRGTTRPFEVLGAPWLDGFRLADALHALALPGFVARPMTFQPTFHKHARKTC